MTALALVACSSVSSANGHALSLDDLLQIEGLGRAKIDPTGRWLFYEKIRPYSDLTDFSFGNYPMGQSGHQIWRYDLKANEGPSLVPGIENGPSSYLLGFSPRGRYLAFVQYDAGEVSLAAFDLQQERIVVVDRTPALGRFGEFDPVWISEDELIFAALPVGELPFRTSVRPYAAKIFEREWRDSWRGDVVTAHEVRTRAGNGGERVAGSLIRANVRTGSTTIVAEGLYTDLRLSPHGDLLAALETFNPGASDPHESAAWLPPPSRLVIFNIGSGARLTASPELEFFPYTIAWSPDGQRLVAYGWPLGQAPRNGRFHIVEPVSGATIQYDHNGLELASERERGWHQRPERTVLLGDDLVVFARRIPENEDQAPRFDHQDVQPQGLPSADWYALSRDGSTRNLTGDLAEVSAVPVHAGHEQFTIWASDGVYRIYANGSRRRLTPEFSGGFAFLPFGNFASRAGVIRPEFGSDAMFRVADGEQTKIVIVDLRNGHEGETVIVSAPPSNAEPLAGSLASKSVVFRVEDGPISRLVLTRADDSVREIDAINQHLSRVDPGEWRIISYEVEDPEQNSTPQTIESCVLLPPGYDGGPLPLIVEVYPNARPACRNDSPSISSPDPTSAYLWAERGYAYARLTTPRELIRTAEGPIAGIDELLDAGVGSLVEEGLVDPNRVALFGASQGGISALYTAAYSDRFKAIIAMNSWADLFSHYFGSSGIYTHAYDEYFGDFTRYDSERGTDFAIGRTPFEDPDIYIRNSPVFLAPQIDAPVMLIHSDMDAFPMSQFDEMYGALDRAGKDVRYVRYFGEGHRTSSPANIRDMWQRIDAFLAETGVAPNGD
ncbi:alpha/beta hydrolase family protein [Pelagerythrobacter aerophilus]|nr:prolyl oligopeptidase family serine peptidase [Pelagerythrobacter aerophilus]